MTERKNEDRKEYDCPHCSVGLNTIIEGDAGAHWVCPTCGHYFYDEKELMSQLGIKGKDKKE